MVGKERKLLQNFWQENLKMNLYSWTKRFDKKDYMVIQILHD